MLQIFDIKKKKNLGEENTNLLQLYNELSKKENNTLLKEYDTTISGLNPNIASARLKENGKNIVIKEENKSPFYFLINSFKDQFIILLIFLAIVNYFLSDLLGSIIILLIATISALIRFVQDYSVYKFNQKLKEKIYNTTTTIRGNTHKEIKIENVVVGDIITLNAGSIIPADLILLETKDLFLNQSVFTGEVNPIEKKAITNKNKDQVFDLDRVCLMGSSVISGKATGLVIETGPDTYLGKVGKEIKTKKELTAFDKGIKSISRMLIKYMIIISIIIIIIDGLFKQNITEAVMFALSVAVGLTPSMLPMIVNVNLTKGSKSLSKKKTLVKKIEAIQNLGAIDILCTDKTGTLTEGTITLQKYIDASGKENNDILEYAYLNSYYGTGIKNIIDKAIITYATSHNINIDKYEKIDEIPFDYTRKKQTIAVKRNNKVRTITKGAFEEIIKNCTTIKINKKVEPINNTYINNIKNKAKELAEKGMQVIALSEGNELEPSKYEENMTFIGFVAFLDPPKKDAQDTIKKLNKIGIKTKIITGDNQYATLNICKSAGLNSTNILLGSDIDKLNDEELLTKIEEVDIYARMNPLQKERIVTLYKNNNHVVGYMGDGVNDAPSLAKADVGISVNTATSIAKEASDIIILKQSLTVIYDGVIEGRKVYGNIMKYMKMALSADFGDVFSITIAAIFFPFLPLLPIQMLLQDFIYDISQLALPYDNVDKEFLQKPKKWNTKGISKFMKIMGITSSLIDILAFIIFWFILGYNNVSQASYFQTAWFVTCLATELMIIYSVRSSKNTFMKDASPYLNTLTIVSLILTILTPIILTKISSFHFEVLPPVFYIYLILLILLYFFIVRIIKKIYIKKYGEWL